MNTIELWRLILTAPLGSGKTYWAMKMAADRRATFIAVTRDQAKEATRLHGIKAFSFEEVKGLTGFRGPYVVDPDAIVRLLDNIQDQMNILEKNKNQAHMLAAELLAKNVSLECEVKRLSRLSKKRERK